MSDGSQLNQSLPTLSEGNIVTVAARLFMTRGGTYFVTSLLAHLWLYLAFGGTAIILAILGVTTFFVADNNWTEVLGGVTVAALVMSPLLFFVWGRYLASGGLVSRLVFNYLTHTEEPQEVSRGQIYPRVWFYLLASVCYGLLLLFLYVGIALVLYGIWLGLFPFFEVLLTAFNDPSQSPYVIISALLLLLVVGLIVGLILYYFAARLWFFDVILALEEQANPVSAVMRSWELTQKQGFKVMTTLFIASIVTAPPVIMASIVNYFVPLASILLAVVVFPFWQAMKAVHYYELRHRNEGLNFDLNRPFVQPRRFLQRVALQTPESIELDLGLGGIGSRAFAWIIDQTILFLSLFALWYVGGAIYAYVVVPAVETGALNTLNLWTISIASLLSYALANGYYIGFETFWRGQTPGKRWAKIRVIQENGQPVGLKESAIRSLMGLIDINFFFIGVALVAFGKSEKRLGDFAAGTLVIQDEKRQRDRTSPVELTFGERSQTTAQQLVHEANIKAVNADQYLILRDFLGYRTQLSPSIRKRVTVNLATQLRQLIAPPESPAALNYLDEELLEATYLACRTSM